jgi:hypothetical protein
MKFETGDQVEILDSIRGVWIPAHIVRRWSCVRVEPHFRVEDGEGFFEYDCDGMDDVGPFHGRFTESYVRPRTVTA